MLDMDFADSDIQTVYAVYTRFFGYRKAFWTDNDIVCTLYFLCVSKHFWLHILRQGKDKIYAVWIGSHERGILRNIFRVLFARSMDSNINGNCIDVWLWKYIWQHCISCLVYVLFEEKQYQNNKDTLFITVWWKVCRCFRNPHLQIKAAW